MLLGYFVTQIPNRAVCDVLPHVGADVCLPVTLASQYVVQTVISTSKMKRGCPSFVVAYDSSVLMASIP
jgi:hypothetical protein